MLRHEKIQQHYITQLGFLRPVEVAEVVDLLLNNVVSFSSLTLLRRCNIAARILFAIAGKMSVS